MKRSRESRERIRRAVHETAIRRQCPRCGRKGALTVRQIPDTGVWKHCRYCGWSTEERGPTMERADTDAANLIALLISDCDPGPNDHSWRKCQRCAAMHLLEQREPFTLRLLAHAIDVLRREVSPDPRQRGT